MDFPLCVESLKCYIRYMKTVRELNDEPFEMFVKFSMANLKLKNSVLIYFLFFDILKRKGLLTGLFNRCCADRGWIAFVTISGLSNLMELQFSCLSCFCSLPNLLAILFSVGTCKFL